MINRILFSFILLSPVLMYQAHGQNGDIDSGELSGQINAISTAVPFLMIAPDSRGGGLGDAGVATTPDANSMHWNPAKYAFIENEMGASISYTPWLRELVNDINLLYLAGYTRLSDLETVALSLRYFSLGDITFTDIRGEEIRNHSPNEFALDIGYSRKLSDNFSGSVAFRYIRSDLTGGISSGSAEQTYPGNAFAADLAFYYQKDVRIDRNRGLWSWGINVSNIGTKISYTDGAEKDFIPTNLKLGTALEMELDSYNKVAFTIDFNKFLVPTPPRYAADSTGVLQIVAGKESDVSVPVGIFQSFSDAPGGFSEELKEINISAGVEYTYAEQFSIRGGYFYENEIKGNRKYFTAGLGIKYNVLDLDFSYLIAVRQNNPLANTLRFSITMDMEELF